jgi:hypothetical protein
VTAPPNPAPAGAEEGDGDDPVVVVAVDAGTDVGVAEDVGSCDIMEMLHGTASLTGTGVGADACAEGGGRVDSGGVRGTETLCAVDDP